MPLIIWCLSLILLAHVPQSYADDRSSYVFRIGIALPLTGDIAEYGSAVKNGIQLAESRFPSEFKRLKLLYDDNRYDAKAALSIVQKFRQQNVDLLYSWGEVPFNAIAPVVEKAGIPLTAYSLDNTAARKSKFIVLTSNDPKSLTAPLVTMLRRRGLKHFGVVKMEDPYINACIEGFRSNLLPGETLDIISTALPGEPDMKPHALRAGSSRLDAIGVYLYPGQISAFYRSLGGFRSAPSTFGTDIFESRREIQSAGRAMQGALYPNFQMPEWFAKEYVDRFKDDAQISYAYNGYAWAVIAAKVLAKASDKLSAGELVAAFKSVQGHDVGLTFRQRETTDSVHFFEFPIIVREIVDGGFRTIGSEDPGLFH